MGLFYLQCSASRNPMKIPAEKRTTATVTTSDTVTSSRNNGFMYLPENNGLLNLHFLHRGHLIAPS
jgi:hypothetical protein